VKDEAALQMHVYVFVGDSAVIGPDDGEWKTMSVQFQGGAIADGGVRMLQGAPGQITAQIDQVASSWFQAADLGGAPRRFPTAPRQS
jgi:hypothetical protein